MKRLAFVAIGVFVFALPAFALNNRSAVSINGLDTNPCSVASPCRSFNVAIAQTNPGGEIIALDSAGYGAFTISTSMTVSGAPGVHAAITVTFGDAILVNAAATDVVTINNLTMIGPAATHAVSVSQAADVRVLNCMIVSFDGSSIRGRSGRLTVDRCVILDDTNSTAIIIGNTSGPSVQGVITNTLLENNIGGGVAVNGAGLLSVANCTIVGGNVGVQAFSTAGTADAARITVESSTLAFLNIVAVQSDANGGNNSAVIYLAQNHISYCPVGVQVLNAGAVKSYSNNRFSEVPTVGPVSPVSLQ